MNDILTFSLVALLLVLSPGPNGILILKTASGHGREPAFANILGITTATFFHGAISIFGLSALLLQSANIFMLVKILGAAYLFYIGTKAIFQSFKQPLAANALQKNNCDRVSPNRSRANFYTEGFLTQILNPKVSMFYLAAFPQFISFENSSYIAAFTLVAIHAGMIFIWFIGVTLAIHKIKAASNTSSVGKWIQRASGSLMIYFSSLLLTQKI